MQHWQAWTVLRSLGLSVHLHRCMLVSNPFCIWANTMAKALRALPWACSNPCMWQRIPALRMPALLSHLLPCCRNNLRCMSTLGSTLPPLLPSHSSMGIGLMHLC